MTLKHVPLLSYGPNCLEIINGHRFPRVLKGRYALTAQVAVKAIKSAPTPASTECQNMP